MFGEKPGLGAGHEWHGDSGTGRGLQGRRLRVIRERGLQRLPGGKGGKCCHPASTSFPEDRMAKWHTHTLSRHCPSAPAHGEEARLQMSPARMRAAGLGPPGAPPAEPGPPSQHAIRTCHGALCNRHQAGRRGTANTSHNHRRTHTHTRDFLHTHHKNSLHVHTLREARLACIFLRCFFFLMFSSLFLICGVFLVDLLKREEGIGRVKHP